MSAFMRVGSRSTGRESNPELIRTDQIISRLELRLRRVLIRHFCTEGPLRLKAGRHGLPKSTYFDLLDEAIWYVHTCYDKPDIASHGQPDYKDAVVGVSTAMPTQ
jgi:hypothetical protein